MKARITIFVAGSLALCVATPTLFAQGAKPPVTNPSAAQAKKQADGNDDIMSGRKGAPGTAKKGGTQAQGQGKGQEPNAPQARKSQMAPSGQGNPGQAGGGQWSKQKQTAPSGQGNPGQAGGGQWSQQKQMAPSGQGNPGQAGGGQWQKGNEMKGAASAKGAASSKAAEMHK